MKIQRECISCILNQIIRVSDFLNLNETDKDSIMKKALSRSARYDYKDLTPPEFSEFLYDIVVSSLWACFGFDNNGNSIFNTRGFIAST